jgi:hypothetical protein
MGQEDSFFVPQGMAAPNYAVLIVTALWSRHCIIGAYTSLMGKPLHTVAEPPQFPRDG